MQRLQVYCLATLVLFAGCSRPTKPSLNLQDPSVARKERTEAQLKSLGVPINPHLPRVESETEVKLRAPGDVARRAIVLYALSAVGHGADNQRAVSWLKREGLWESVSPKERQFFESARLPDQEKINATWRAESLWVLLWALGKTPPLDLPREEVNLDSIQELMPAPDTSCAQFINEATLRTRGEILDATDLIYRIHWAVVDERINGRQPPAQFIESLVYERHYALNWLTWYANSWDDITTDT